MPRPELAPIADSDLGEFCAFLTHHLNPNISAEQFQSAFRQRWGMDKPNHGFVVRDQGAIVGGIGAIYALRTLHGKPERFCNITSWCVLDAYRAQSMRLAMALVSQEGFHFTDLTPTDVVAKSLQFLKFKPLNGARTVIPNTPAFLPGVRVMSDPQAMGAVLPPEVRQVYSDHARFPWLYHVAVGKPGAFCYVVYKRKTLKGLPSAEVVAISDGGLFSRYLRAFGTHVLFRHGMATTRIESRLLPRRPLFAREVSGYRPKMYRSESLGENDIDNLYSELVALEL